MPVISVVDCNIALQKGQVDGIVNAANDRLSLGGGVAKAIKDACGEAQLQGECEAFLNDLSGCLKMQNVPTGSAAVTGAYRMAPTQVIIHAVAPFCAVKYVRTLDQARQLKCAYDSALAAAESYSLKSVAIPYLGAGIFNYPPAESVEVALMSALDAFSVITTIEEIRFVSNDRSLVRQMQSLLRGSSVSVSSMADIAAIRARISKESLKISGSPSNSKDIKRCLNLAKDANMMAARQARLQQGATTPSASRALFQNPPSIMNNLKKIVRGTVNTIKLESIDKALSADVDIFITFGECYDPENVRVDLGPFAGSDIEDSIVELLLDYDKAVNMWTAVSVDLSLPSNRRPRKIICIARQHRDAVITGFIRRLVAVLGKTKQESHCEKIGIILPSTCLFPDHWKSRYLVFAVLGTWKTGEMAAFSKVILLAKKDELSAVRNVLLNETNFGSSVIDKVLKSMEPHKLIYVEATNKNFKYRAIDKLIKITTQPSPPAPLMPCATPINARVHPMLLRTESPEITQIFRDMATGLRKVPVPVVPVVAPIDTASQPECTTRVSIGVLKDLLDEEGDILAIPIDSDLLLCSTELAKRLQELGGEDFEEEVHSLDKMVEEKQLNREELEGCVFPISAHNLRQFKTILLMVNVSVKFTTKTTEEERLRLKNSYSSLLRTSIWLSCKRLVVTLSSVQSHGFRIQEATSIATAAIFNDCPSEVAEIHFAMNETSIGMLRSSIFNSTTFASISDPSHGQAFAKLMFPSELVEGATIRTQAMMLMTHILCQFAEEEAEGSQASQRDEQDPDDFGGFVEADLRELCGEEYSETLIEWPRSSLKERKSSKLAVGSILTTNKPECTTSKGEERGDESPDNVLYWKTKYEKLAEKNKATERKYRKLLMMIGRGKQSS